MFEALVLLKALVLAKGRSIHFRFTVEKMSKTTFLEQKIGILEYRIIYSVFSSFFDVSIHSE